ncbi:hypothetical protein Acr_21g0011780 [Actinidia rufa]|uniref:Uncharacterized protein n=1 Tax=Actinidia rufa TaxID=165716 RepID=A0A7J0GIF4_9ERIC|nr:hypothetical protein Acr_21g0011780 [Actinidia rufa]
MLPTFVSVKPNLFTGFVNKACFVWGCGGVDSLTLQEDQKEKECARETDVTFTETTFLKASYSGPMSIDEPQIKLEQDNLNKPSDQPVEMN